MKRPGIRSGLALSVVLASGAFAGEETIQLKDGAGRELAASRCVICHSLDYIQMNAEVMDRAKWEKSVRKMIDFGAPISGEDARKIVDYLTAQYSS